MSTQKRDALATGSALIVPITLNMLDSAESALNDGKYDDAAKRLAEAKDYLTRLISLFEEACTELRAE
jgi:hypothetical protein